MCFSAEASFGAGTILSMVGIVTMKKVQEPAQLAFAAIPLFFGVQQITEGFVWISLSQNTNAFMQQVAVYWYMFFSHIVWPFWVPFSVLLFEKEQKRKNILFGIFSLALLLCASEVYNIATYGVRARIDGHHIQYIIGFPKIFITVSDIIYPLVTLVPCFISSYKKMRLFSAVLMLSVIIAELFYKQWRISVWCFFAAALSVVVYFILKKLPENKKMVTTV